MSRMTNDEAYRYFDNVQRIRPLSPLERQWYKRARIERARVRAERRSFKILFGILMALLVVAVLLQPAKAGEGYMRTYSDTGTEIRLSSTLCTHEIPGVYQIIAMRGATVISYGCASAYHGRIAATWAGVDELLFYDPGQFEPVELDARVEVVTPYVLPPAFDASGVPRGPLPIAPLRP